MSALRNGIQNGTSGTHRFNRPLNSVQPANNNNPQNHSGRADNDNQWRNRQPVNGTNRSQGYSRGGFYPRGRRTPQNQDWPQFGENVERKVAINSESEFELLKLFAEMNITRKIKYAKKPQPGKIGRSIELLANYFKLNFEKKEPFVVYHYDVSIEIQDSPTREDAFLTPGPRRRSKKLDKRFNVRIIEQMVLHNNKKEQVFYEIIPVYDFEKNLFTRKELTSKSPLRFEVKTKEFEQQTEEVYIVSLRLVSEFEVNPTSHILSAEALQLIDIAVQYGPSRDKIPVGNEIFFLAPENRVKLGAKNKEVAYGFYQSARNSEAGLVLNVDRATSLFHIGDPLLAVFEKCIPGFSKLPMLSTRIVREMTKDLKGTRMKLLHLPHFLIRVNHFTHVSAAQIMFKIKDTDKNGKVSERNISVADYYKEKYGSERLLLPNLPCVVTGNPSNPKYYPIELCELLPDQYVTKLLPQEVQSKMVRETSKQKPHERFFAVKNSLNNCIVKDGKKFMAEFGISVCQNMIKLKARVIPSPNLRFGDNVIFDETSSGDWMMQKPTPKKFFNPVAINKWMLVDMSLDNDWLSEKFVFEFQTKLINTANQFGVRMSLPLKAPWNRYSFTDTEKLKDVFEKATKYIPGLQMIMFIIPDIDDCYYGVKKVADLDFGIVTQCFNKKQGNKMLQEAYLSNVMLKINAKMNGINWILDVNWNKNKKFMFVGVDVTHPSPGDNTSVSIASCVGNYDDTLARYDTVLSVQEETRCETVDLSSSIAKLLETYKMQNKSLPESIIIYRDGVSEGQFKLVMAHEISKIMDYVASLKQQPKVTYIVVQKRHNTRFLTVKPDEAGEKTFNIPAGTVIDTTVTDPSKFDFFICSQKGQISTSIPSRYWVLYDENNFTADQIQEITFHMCFMYPCSTKSVSIPMPVELADLSAERARHHFEKVFEGESLDLDKDEIRKRKEAFMLKVNNVVKVNTNLSKRLYYI